MKYGKCPDCERFGLLSINGYCWTGCHREGCECKIHLMSNDLIELGKKHGVNIITIICDDRKIKEKV